MKLFVTADSVDRDFASIESDTTGDRIRMFHFSYDGMMMMIKGRIGHKTLKIVRYGKICSFRSVKANHYGFVR